MPKKKLTKKERKAAQREIDQKKKEINKNAKSTKKSLKARVNETEAFANDKAKKNSKERARAKSIFNAIGFNLMYEDGICEVEDGLFSQTLTFSDISYQSARIEDQKTYFKLYSQVFDYCGSETCLQMNIINTPIPHEYIGKKEFFKSSSEEDQQYVDEYNKVLNHKMLEGVSNLERNRYLTYSVSADSYEQAVPRLARMRGDLSSAFNKLGCSVNVLNGIDRLKLIASQLRPDRPFEFDYKELLSSGLTAKDYVCPLSLDFKPQGETSLFKSEDKYCQVLVFRKFGSQLTDSAISDLIDLTMPMNICLHTQAIDKGKSTDFVKNRLGWIDKEVVEYQQHAVKKGFDYQLIPQELQFTKNEGEELLNQLLYQNQRLFIFSGLVYLYADSYEELQEEAVQVISTARRNSIEIDVLDCQQRQGMNSILPLGNNHIEVSRYLTTAQTAMMIPFATQELNQKGGGYYGQNKVSNNLILMNRKSLAAPMGFFLGMPGSGKSFAVKREISNTFFSNPNDEFIIFDPQDEYPMLVQALGGTSFELQKDHLNLFDIYAGAYDVTGEDPTIFKSESILAIASEVMGKTSEGLSPEEKTVIDRCVRLTYAKFANADRPPILQDFYEILKAQPDEEAQRLVLAFELYVTGGLNYFNHQTSANIETRITSFSFKQLGSNMRVFSMLVLLDFAYNRMLYNFERGITTWLYIDEVQSLFANDAIVAYFDKFWSEGRKFNLIPTGITQTVERIIDHPKAKLLLSNSDFLILLRQSDRDRKNLAGILGLSPQQESYIDRTNKPGEGLLIAGPAVIPFKDDWPHGCLYDLWNTKPSEIAEKKKAAWQKKKEEQREKTMNQNSQDNKEKTCPICGSVIADGEGVTMPDGQYLCHDCAEIFS
jgi:hypothetical protein